MKRGKNWGKDVRVGGEMRLCRWPLPLFAQISHLLIYYTELKHLLHLLHKGSYFKNLTFAE